MMTLDTVDIRRRARVILIEGGHGVCSHLNAVGFHIGDWLTVVERAPFRGPVLVEVNGTQDDSDRAQPSPARSGSTSTGPLRRPRQTSARARPGRPPR